MRREERERVKEEEEEGGERERELVRKRLRRKPIESHDPVINQEPKRGLVPPSPTPNSSSDRSIHSA